MSGAPYGNAPTKAPMAGPQNSSGEDEVKVEHAVGATEASVCGAQNTYPEDECKEVVNPLPESVRAPIAAYFDVLCPEASPPNAIEAQGKQHARWEQGLPEDLVAIRNRAMEQGKDVAFCVLNPRPECF